MATREVAIKKLFDEIREYPDFPQTGVVFRDLFSLIKSPDHLKSVMELLIADAKSFGTKIDIVVGLDSRGFLLGPSVAMELNAGFVPVRKGGKYQERRSLTNLRRNTARTLLKSRKIRSTRDKMF